VRFVFLAAFLIPNCAASDYIPGGFVDFSGQYAKAASAVKLYIEPTAGEYRRFIELFSKHEFDGCLKILRDPSIPLTSTQRTTCLDLMTFCVGIVDTEEEIEAIVKLYHDPKSVKLLKFQDRKMVADLYKYISLTYYYEKKNELGQYFCLVSGSIYSSFNDEMRNTMEIKRTRTLVDTSCSLGFCFPNIYDGIQER
jgi:hypothetical protein